nr:MAG TPA: hypothetical protein [Caudoviricetes sp.]
MAKEKKKNTNLEQTKTDIAQLMQDLSDTQRHEVRGIIIGMSLTTAARAEA